MILLVIVGETSLEPENAFQSTKLYKCETTGSRILQPFFYKILVISGFKWFPNFPMIQVMEILSSN